MNCWTSTTVRTAILSSSKLETIAYKVSTGRQQKHKLPWFLSKGQSNLCSEFCRVVWYMNGQKDNLHLAPVHWACRIRWCMIRMTAWSDFYMHASLICSYTTWLHNHLQYIHKSEPNTYAYHHNSLQSNVNLPIWKPKKEELNVDLLDHDDSLFCLPLNAIQLVR